MKPQDYEIVFSGAGSRELKVTGRYVRILEAPVDVVYIKLDGRGKELKRSAGAEIADGDAKGFQKVVVRSAVAQTVRLAVASVPQQDNSQNVNVSASATIQPGTVLNASALVEVPALSSVQLIAGNPDRTELRVALASTEAGHVWLGPSGVGDEEGGLLEPGMVDYLATTAAVHAYNPHPTDSVWVSVLESEAP